MILKNKCIKKKSPHFNIVKAGHTFISQLMERSAMKHIYEKLGTRGEKDK